MAFINKHEMHSFSGTPRACGKAYGATVGAQLEAFLNMEIADNKRRSKLAADCWQEMQSWQQPVVEFAAGMAEGSGLTPEKICQLLLHEEMAHDTHCTGFAATGEATKTGAPIIAQNWDWAARLLPWSHLLRLNPKGGPRTLTYAYPGLWASAGLNEHGVSLVWTGGGYFPRLAPVVGIPTYALIAGILNCSSSQEAVELVKNTHNAGCFLFFISDPSGETWVLEGWSGSSVAVRCKTVMGRANHYITQAAREGSKQVVPHWSKCNSGARYRRVQALLKQHSGSINRSTAEAILSDHGRRPGQTICQHANQTGRWGMTVDSFYILPTKRELWIAYGEPCRHKFNRYRLDT